jgi:hypothetical protein
MQVKEFVKLLNIKGSGDNFLNKVLGKDKNAYECKKLYEKNPAGFFVGIVVVIAQQKL